MNNLTGRAIRGYELRTLIGEGGFGAVYRAYQPAVKRDVALKAILPDFANHPDFIRNFETEAQLVARLEHLHIVPLYDFWREPDGAYLVMRLLRGGSLNDLIGQGPIAKDRASRILDQVGAALATAHRHGIIHRDIKPANILFDEEGNAYLTDFGIAKDISQTEKQTEVNIVGTPAYLSPEQALDQPVSPRSDIYSLGIVLFEMLTGKLGAMGATTMWETVQNQINEPLPSLLTFDLGLGDAEDAVIQQATAKDPQQRYVDVISMVSDFRKIARHNATVPLGEWLKTQAAPLPDTISISVIEPGLNNPYKGLRAFEEADAADFYGRDDLTQRLLAHLKSNPFLAVVGPSGSGKSSVVKAGLVPSIRGGAIPTSERWFVVEITPGTTPFQQLESALLGIATEKLPNLQQRFIERETTLSETVERILPATAPYLLLVIDQFEEVFTQVSDEHIRAAILNNLLVAATRPNSRLRLVVTLRADFYDRPLLYPGFGELMRQHTEVVLPLSVEEMKDAIISPAENIGLTVEPALVSAIVAEVGQQPGALPLLQYALTEVFERRKGATLTYEAYQATGGVLGSLARRAEELYVQLDTQRQHITREIFLRLVTLGDGADDTRRRITVPALFNIDSNEASIQAVLDLYGKYRLLTFDHDPLTRVPTVEVAHEALLRQWQRLGEWLDDSRDDLRVRQRLSAAAHEWSTQGRDPSFLATGARLQQFETLLIAHNISLIHDELDYVRSSSEKQAVLEQEETTRQAHERELESRSKRRLQAIVSILTIASVIGILLTIGIFIQSQSAQNERDKAVDAQAVAEERAIEARSLALATGARQELSNGDSVLALLLALEAVAVDEPPTKAYDTLLEIAYAPGLRQVLMGHDEPVTALAISPDGTLAISGIGTGVQDTNPTLANANTPPQGFPPSGAGNPPPGGPPPQGGPPAPPTATPSVITFERRPRDLIVWDLATGTERYRLQGHIAPIDSIVFVSNTIAISGSTDGDIIVWDLAKGASIRHLSGFGIGTVRLATSAAQGWLLSGGSDGPAPYILWNIETGEMIKPITLDRLVPPAALALSTQGRLAVSGYVDGTVILWDVETEAVLHTFEIDASSIKNAAFKLAFSPDEQTIAINLGSDEVILWSAETQQESRIQTLSASVFHIAWSGDSQTLLTVSPDGISNLWDVPSLSLRHQWVIRDGQVESIAMNPQGTLALLGLDNGTIDLWDIVDTPNDKLATFSPQDLLKGGGYVPNTNTVLTFGAHRLGNNALESHLVISDAQTGDILTNMGGNLSNMPQTLDISHDGHWALTGTNFNAPGVRATSDGDKLILWNLMTGEIVNEITYPSDMFVVTAAIDSSSGQDGTNMRGASSWGQDIRVWDLNTGDVLVTFTGHTNDVTDLAFTADGSELVSVGRDNTLRVWDIETGAVIAQIDIGAVSTFLTLSPTQYAALTASTDNSIALWDLATGELIQRYVGHDDAPSAAQFSSDGSRIISGGGDLTVYLWDAVRGSFLQRFEDGHTSRIWGVDFGPDDLTAMSVSEEQVIIWRVDPLSLDEIHTWIDTNRYLRDFTASECQRYAEEDLCG